MSSKNQDLTFTAKLLGFANLNRELSGTAGTIGKVGSAVEQTDRKAQSARGLAIFELNARKSARKAESEVRESVGGIRSALSGLAGSALGFAGFTGIKDAFNQTKELTEGAARYRNIAGLTTRQSVDLAAASQAAGVQNNALASTFGTLARNIDQAGRQHDTYERKLAKARDTTQAMKALRSSTAVRLMGLGGTARAEVRREQILADEQRKRAAILEAAHRRVADVRATGPGASQAALRKLGITPAQIKSGQGDLLSFTELISDRLRRVPAGAQRTALMRAVLGRSATTGALGELLTENGIFGLRGRVADIDTKIPKSLGASGGLEQLLAAQARMSDSVLGASVSVGQGLTPAATTFANLVPGLIRDVRKFKLEIAGVGIAVAGVKLYRLVSPLKALFGLGGKGGSPLEKALGGAGGVFKKPIPVYVVNKGWGAGTGPVKTAEKDAPSVFSRIFNKGALAAAARYAGPIGAAAATGYLAVTEGIHATDLQEAQGVRRGMLGPQGSRTGALGATGSTAARTAGRPASIPTFLDRLVRTTEHHDHELGRLISSIDDLAKRPVKVIVKGKPIADAVVDEHSYDRARR